MADINDTIAAIATASGRSGIGIVRLSGPQSLSIAQTLIGFTPKLREASYAAFNDAQGGAIDKGIVLYFQCPASFTGEDIIELQGHGGPVVMKMLLERVLQLGARQARPGEFTERAYLNDKIDLLQAEAVAGLIDSVSEQAVRCALRSLDGEFSKQIQKLVSELIAIRAYVEGALDFPEEEIDFLADGEIKNRIETWENDLAQLIKKAQGGRILTEGIRVVIMGRPNVGKSSVLNRLTETDRAIVTETPGTTRDLIEDNIVIEGVPINIVDTAGLREQADKIEREGIRRAIEAGELADVLLFVLEAGPDTEEQLTALQKNVPTTQKTLVAVNKIDLYPEQAHIKQDQTRIYLSAMTGEGVDVLRKELLRVTSMEEYGENSLLARSRHIEALQAAKDGVSKSMFGYKQTGAAELLAEELSAVQKLLSKITGEFSSDDLLGEIFSSFCIGK